MASKEDRFCKPRLNAAGLVARTRFLYVVGVGDELGSDKEKVRNFFSKFGDLDYSSGDAIEMVPKRRFCYVCFATSQAAEDALNFVQNSSDNCSSTELTIPGSSSKIVAKYAIEKSSLVAAINQIESTTSARNMSVNVPGCHILSDFIDENEENSLLGELTSECAPWRETLSRRVQHFGFTFNYRTLMLDYGKPTPPLPPSCVALGTRFNAAFADILDKEKGIEPSVVVDNGDLLAESDSAKEQDRIELPTLNQLTINEYLPGQGIASHTGEYLTAVRSCTFLILLLTHISNINSCHYLPHNFTQTLKLVLDQSYSF